MKKYYYPTFISTRLMALAMVFYTMGLMTSCSNEDDSNTARDPEPIRTYYMSVDATKGSNEAASRTNRALSLSGSTLSASWAIGENVYVYAVTAISPFWFDGSIQPQSEGTSTLLNGQISLPSGWEGSISDYVGKAPKFTLQFPRSGELDYTGQVGTLADIATKYDYAIATDVMFDIEADHIIAINSATFETQQAIVKFTLVEKNNETNVLSPTDLIIDYGSESISLTSIPGATYTTNGNGVIYVAIPGFSNQEVTLRATVGSDTYTYTKSNVTFQNGKYYEIGVKMTK